MTTELKTKIRQVNSFIDESFDLKKLNDFHLILQAGNDGLFAIVFEKEKNKYIAFEYYSFQQVYNFELLGDLFDIAGKESRIIAHKYRSVTFSLVNNLSTIVPSALFENDKKKMYLQFNTQLQSDDTIMVDEIKNLDAKNIFALPVSLKTKIDSFYPKVSYHHFSTGLIETLLAQNRNQTKKKLYVHVQSSHFEAIVIEGKSLHFYNTFNYHSAEDFIYYLLFVCEQLYLNPENIETVIIGEIERSSAIYNLMQKYVRTLKFGERSDNTDYSYQLQTFPKHFYFSLFNSFLVS
jgi:hypothetical protein